MFASYHVGSEYQSLAIRLGVSPPPLLPPLPVPCYCPFSSDYGIRAFLKVTELSLASVTAQSAFDPFNWDVPMAVNPSHQAQSLGSSRHQLSAH